MRLQDHLDRLRNSPDLSDLEHAFANALPHYGFDRYRFTLLDTPAGIQHEIGHHFLFDDHDGNSPAPFSDMASHDLDPALEAVSRALPFAWSIRWDDARDALCAESFDGQAYSGPCSGIGIPLFNPGGARAAMAVASSTAYVAVSPREVTQLHMLSIHYHDRFRHLTGSTAPETGYQPLTRRETDTLIWLARGLTKSQIGALLHISVHTVDHHTRNILDKLKCRNIAAAVYIATSHGLIPAHDKAMTRRTGKTT